jgi:nitrogen fixation/metabolism regulation signal transduction histidine kinase
MASEPRHGRLGFERRLKLWVAAFALAAIVPLAVLVYSIGGTPLTVIVSGAIALSWAMAGAIFFDRIIRPLQTLANIVAALREDDFSFRARGASRGDAMGELALEINELASTLQQQRAAAQDALSLAERVMLNMASPVLVFDSNQKLRLMNAAAERVFSLDHATVLGCSAEELNLAGILRTADDALFSGRDEAPVRWSVRRTAFRLRGAPHTLLVLTDVASLLREEERTAWQRLIRVLGHEINNSLTPIKSIAGSLQSRIATDKAAVESEDFVRGLSVIEDRAASLNRFLQAYQRLSKVPQPRLVETNLRTAIERVAQLETRIPVQAAGDLDVMVLADVDQLQQMLINLVQNAVDAALSVERAGHPALVELACSARAAEAIVTVRDNGPGLTNPSNLFVPFYTTKPNGTGIGLLLAQQISIAHHGSVRLMNRRDTTGCEAEVRLPLLRR